MIVRVGVLHTPKEIELEMADDLDRDQLKADIEKAVTGGDGVLWLVDRKGRSVGVPAGKVAWVEVGVDSGSRRVGFSA
jgi:hypothetical protein